MKKLLLVLSILLTILTFAGAFYVFLSNGTANAGYAAVPMLFAIYSYQTEQQMQVMQQYRCCLRLCALADTEHTRIKSN